MLNLFVIHLMWSRNDSRFNIRPCIKSQYASSLSYVNVKNKAIIFIFSKTSIKLSFHVLDEPVFKIVLPFAHAELDK